MILRIKSLLNFSFWFHCASWIHGQS